jgi:hypothetical protein
MVLLFREKTTTYILVSFFLLSGCYSPGIHKGLITTGGGGHGDAHANVCRISQRPPPGEVDGGGGRGARPFALHPSPQGSRIGREGQLEEWAQRPHKVDLMGTILLVWGHSKWRPSSGRCGNTG